MSNGFTALERANLRLRAFQTLWDVEDAGNLEVIKKDARELADWAMTEGTEDLINLGETSANACRFCGDDPLPMDANEYMIDYAREYVLLEREGARVLSAEDAKRIWHVMADAYRNRPRTGP